jgi:2-amino-4-hydroxy-6-hydroxymethyldihydropteridine diphosphokinase
MDKTQVILSLGSNIVPRTTFIERALEALSELPHIHLLRSSSLYETEPVDVPEDEDHLLFLNVVAIVETMLPPETFLHAVQDIEETLGRRRTGRYGAARTIDMDIIAFGDMVMDTPTLTLPHPRSHLRTFVLAPLAELLPDYRLPGQQQTVTQLLTALTSA